MNSGNCGLLAVGLLVSCGVSSVRAANDGPDFGPHVLIFDPAMTNIQARIDAIFSQQERSQFVPVVLTKQIWLL